VQDQHLQAMTGAGNTPREGVARKAGRAAHPQNLVERRLTKFLHEPPSVRLAANVIVTATVLVVVLGGVMMRVLDHKEYASIWTRWSSTVRSAPAAVCSTSVARSR